MLQSATSNAFERIFERITERVPEIRYIAQDIGQLDNYEMRPPVAWPCLLVDLDDIDFSDITGRRDQLAAGHIVFRLGLLKLTELNNLTPVAVRERGHYATELEAKIFGSLHGWAPAGFGRLLRRKSYTEKRDDDIRIRGIIYKVNFTDHPPKDHPISVDRPPFRIGRG